VLVAASVCVTDREETMDRHTAIAFATIFVGSGLVLGTSASAEQKSLKDQLVGSWIFVSSTTKAEDGSPLWGTNPKGIALFTANGRYSTHLMRADRPKFAANSRAKGTPEENKAAVVGNISSFGSYTVDEAKKTFTIRFEGSTYPNLEGTVQTRPFEIVGDELRVTNPSPTVGGPPSNIVYPTRQVTSESA
jgi:Lipocalin-like domain